MKHKIVTHSFSEFGYLWAGLVERLKQTGERIVRAKFVFAESSYMPDKFAATVWTEHEKEGGDHADRT